MAVIRYARVAALVAGLWAATGAGAANDPVAEETAVRERSIESFQQLLSKYPESSMRAPVLLLLGDLYAEREKSRYLAEVGRAETGGTPESAPALDYTEAIGAYEEVAALGAEFAGSVEALHALGVCYDEMGRADEAERVLAQASGLTADPALRASSLLRLGDLRFSRENWPGALDAYRAADEAGADAAAEKLDYRIGWCHLKQGELEEARARFAAALDGALRGDPGSRPEESLSEILRSLALVQVQTDPSDPEGFAARFPDGPCRRAALVEFGEVLLEHDRPEYGERALRQALSMDRQAADAPEVHDHIVEALSAEERKREAGAEMEKFVERYAPGGDWWSTRTADADREAEVRGLVLRNCWNAALIRFESGTEGDLRAAGELFERYTGELGGVRDASRARLFAAEAWFGLGDLGRALARFGEVVVEELPAEEREHALRGEVLAHQSLARPDDGFARAAFRYATAYPESEEAKKALLLAAEREETAGRLASALDLCALAARTEDPVLRGEAEARAGRLAAAANDRAAAETWYLRAAQSAPTESDRLARLERAAASAFLIAGDAVAAGRPEEAAEQYARVFRDYRGTSVGSDALLGEIACRAAFDAEERVVPLADTAAVLLAGSERANAALGEAAEAAARADRLLLAARLHDAAHRTLPRAESLLGAGAAYEAAGANDTALARYESAAALAAGTPLASEAFARLGGCLDADGGDARAALAFDRALETGDGSREVEFLSRAGACYLETSDLKKAKERFARAVEKARSGAAPTPAEELYGAKALLGMARVLRGPFEEEIARWRRGGSGEKAARLLEERVGLYRGAIERRFEGTTEDAAFEAASALELFGRSGFLREWDRGKLGDPSLLEPHFADATLLYRAAGRERAGRPRPYAALADTLIERGEAERRAAPPAAALGVEGSSPDDYGLALQAIESADEKWSVAAELLRRQEAVRAEAKLRMKRTALVLRSAASIEEGARLLRAAPEPSGLAGEEIALYRSLVEEKARAFEAKAASWYLDLPDATPEVAASRPLPGAASNRSPREGEVR